MPQIKAIIGADTKQFNAAMKGVQQQMKMLQGLKNIGTSIAAGFAVGSVFDFGSEINRTAVSLESISAKASIVFGEFKGDVEAMANVSANALGLTSSEFVKAAASAADLLIPMGFGRKEATDMSTKLIQLSGALSAWTGGQVNSKQVSDILTKALLGEREQLKALGISISEADVKARLAAGGNEKLTGAALEQAKAIATLELIMGKSLDAQTAFSSGTKTLAMQQAELSAKFGEVREAIASKLTPVVLGVTNALVEFFSGIESATTAFDKQNKSVADLSTNISPLIERYDDLKGKTMLSADEQTEMADIIKRVATTIPSAITAFDKYGNAISISSERARQFIDTEIARLKVMNQSAIDEIKKTVAEIDSELFVLDKKMQEIEKTGKFTISTTTLFGPGSSRTTTRQSTNDEVKQAIEQYKQLTEQRKGYFAELENLNGEYLKKEIELAEKTKTAHEDVTTVIENQVAATKEMVKATRKLIDVIPTMPVRTGKPTDDIPGQLDKDLYNYFNQKVNDQKELEVSNNMKPREVGDVVGMGKTAQQAKELLNLTNEVNQSVENLLENMAIGIGEGLGNLFSGVGSMSDVFDSILRIIGDFMIEIGKSLIQTAIAVETFKNILIDGPAAIVAGIALIALGTAFKNKVAEGPGGGGGSASGVTPRKFADGGIVFGPTFGLLGEYANARRNPEVVAPLSKLQSIIGSRGGDAQELFSRISGHDIYISNKRMSRRVSRISGGLK